MAISEVLHIRPWEQRELLTVDEFERACAYIDDMNKRAEEAERKAR